ncbi:uncharacterized protein LOC141666552 isoform X3 [Apium graveolens]|uniref:uncharacterized protein LOC141666552 isoform X3 n=1 Tax=Apium graveolens TaxID=4045 RepID=UPI003D7BE384
MDAKLKLKLLENRRRVEEEYRQNRVHYRLRQKAGSSGNKMNAPDMGKKRKVDDTPTSDTGKKRKVDDAPISSAPPAPGKKRKVDDAPTSKPGTSLCNKYGRHIAFLFEFASGYALFDAHGMYEYPGFSTTFKIAEKYLNNNPFTLRAFYPFSSPGDALHQMKAICNSNVTKELKTFLVDNIPQPRSDYQIAVANAMLGRNICLATGIFVIVGQIIDQVMRGLRAKIDKFIDLEPGDLRMAQLNLARSYRWQSCACKESSIVQRNFHTGIADKVVVVPHKLEGLFVAKGLGKKNFICTKNLVPGKVLHGDKLISVQKDDGTEAEYRLWNPHMSKLAAAILCGLTNIWVKPGSHVLYLGDVCGITVLQLSDLVGSNGMVYVIGLSDVVANTVEERSNVVTIPENFCFRKDYNMVSSKDYRMVNGMDYRMVVGMVDVILGDIVYPDPSLQVNYIARYALLHLKTGGHYLICTRAKNIKFTSQVKDPFADHDKLPFSVRIEFKTNEIVMLEPIGRGHAVAVGGYRMVQ